jgi:hypothetical protein
MKFIHRFWKRDARESPNQLAGGKKEPLGDSNHMADIRVLASLEKYDALLARMKAEPEAVERVRKLLGDPKPGIRMAALGALGQAALAGLDIRPAIPAISRFLGKKGEGMDTQSRAAYVFFLVAKDRPEVRRAAKGLHKMLEGKRVEEVSPYAALALVYATSEQKKLACAVEAISRAIDSNMIISGTGRALGEAARKGADIARPISGLSRRLGNDDIMVVRAAAGELAETASCGASIGAAIAGLSACFIPEDIDLRENAARAVHEAAKHGSDISPAYFGLLRCLGSGNSKLQKDAAGALLEAGNHGFDIGFAAERLTACFFGSDKSVRALAAKALGTTPGKGGLVLALGALVETLFSDSTLERMRASEYLFDMAEWMDDFSRDYVIGKLQALVAGEKYLAAVAQNNGWSEDVSMKMDAILRRIGVWMNEAA